MKRFLTKLFHINGIIAMLFYKWLNRLKFWANDVSFGHNFRAFNSIYLQKHVQSKFCIGDNVLITSGGCYNPLCRNIRASICLEWPESYIEIGNDTGLSSPCLWAKRGIKIGDRVKIGGNCIIMDSDAHSLDWRIRGACFNKKQLIENIALYSQEDSDFLHYEYLNWQSKQTKGFTFDSSMAQTSPIVIDDDVLIGANCIILKGVHIGARSIIAAGSVVTKDIPADCIAAGVPCRNVKNIKE